MLFEFASLTTAQQGKLLRATVTPRPIAWVTSLHADGRCNAAPFSFFNVVCSEPPLVAFGIATRSGAQKDTANNIRATGEFVVNLVPFALAEAMNATSAEFGPEVDELEQVGLDSVPSARVAPPRIAGCPAALECVLHSVIEPGGSSVLVLGRVVAMQIADDVVLDADRCWLDTPRLDLIARMHGRGWYARTTDLFELGRPYPAKD